MEHPDNAPGTVLRKLIGDFVRIDGLQDDTDIFASGYVNSMFAMQLLLFIEKTFSLTVDTTEMNLANFSSIDAMKSFIAGKLQAQPVLD